MGYYSRFEFFEYEDDRFNELSDEVIGYLDEYKDEVEDFDYLLFAMEESCKFYHLHDVMKELTKEFPDKVFHVNREGEEPGDLEQSYYKNGKMSTYRPEIVWPKFNEKELE